MVVRKQWWAPVWTGLVVDAEAKHCRRMKNAVWLYLYLLLNANRRTGTLMRKIKTISSDMGVTRDTTLRWLGILRKEKYIVTENTGRCLHIQINKWQSLADIGKSPQQKQDISNITGGQYPTSKQGSKSQNPIHSGHKTSDLSDPNDITIKKDILKNDIDRKISSNSKASISKQFKPQDKYQLLALDLAKSLNDYDGLALYISYSRKYPESLLRRVLGEVKEIPAEKIKKSRAALFNHLVQIYAQKSS
jgi:hypothetical protein